MRRYEEIKIVGLPPDLPLEEIAALCRRAGEVETIDRSMKVQPGGEPEHGAYVAFANKEDARRAQRLLDGHVLSGRTLRVVTSDRNAREEPVQARRAGSFGPSAPPRRPRRAERQAEADEPFDPEHWKSTFFAAFWPVVAGWALLVPLAAGWSWADGTLAWLFRPSHHPSGWALLALLAALAVLWRAWNRRNERRALLWLLAYGLVFAAAFAPDLARWSRGSRLELFLTLVVTLPPLAVPWLYGMWAREALSLYRAWAYGTIAGGVAFLGAHLVAIQANPAGLHPSADDHLFWALAFVLVYLTGMCWYAARSLDEEETPLAAAIVCHGRCASGWFGAVLLLLALVAGTYP